MPKILKTKNYAIKLSSIKDMIITAHQQSQFWKSGFHMNLNPGII